MLIMRNGSVLGFPWHDLELTTLPTGWTNVNLLYLPYSIEIASLKARNWTNSRLLSFEILGSKHSLI